MATYLLLSLTTAALSENAVECSELDASGNSFVSSLTPLSPANAVVLLRVTTDDGDSSRLIYIADRMIRRTESVPPGLAFLARTREGFAAIGHSYHFRGSSLPPNIIFSIMRESKIGKSSFSLALARAFMI